MDPEIKLPSLLVAMPSLTDPNFEKSVLLLAEHNNKGAMGFVINRPSTYSLRDLVEIENIDIPHAIPAWYGGPVGTNSGLILHNQSDFSGDVELADGITFSSSPLALRSMVECTKECLAELNKPRNEASACANPLSFRFIVGYAGWAPGQLEEELRLGAWIQIPASHTLLFEVSWKEMWNTAVNSIGVDPISLAPSAQPYLN